MSNKLIKRPNSTDSTGKGKSIRQIILGISIIAFILVIVFLFIFLNHRNPVADLDGTNKIVQTSQELKYNLSENGSLIIPKNDIVEDVTYIDYGGSHQILIWKDNQDAMHTAFNTCQECFSRGDAHYTYNNGTLTCSICGNPLTVSSLADESWGGCQPVSIPAEYRDDTESELIFSDELLKYSEDMFEAWEKDDFSSTLEVYRN